MFGTDDCRRADDRARISKTRQSKWLTGMAHVRQPAPEQVAPTEMISANEADAGELHAVNRVVSDSIVSWGLPERVRRLALPSLSYNETDLQHMTIILLTNSEQKGIAIAAWEEASRSEIPENCRGALIHGLYVVPEYQQRGLGTRLIELVAKRMAGLNNDGMAVRAWRDSLAFFRSRGFEPMHSETAPDTFPRRLWRAV